MSWGWEKLSALLHATKQSWPELGTESACSTFQFFGQIVMPRPWPLVVITGQEVFFGREKVLTLLSWPHYSLADYIVAFLNSCPTHPTMLDVFWFPEPLVALGYDMAPFPCWSAMRCVA